MHLWPLLSYQSRSTGERSLHLFGPLFAYEHGPDTVEVTLRPVFSYRRGPRPDHSDLGILYPFWTSRWDGDETSHRLLLITYRSRTARRPDEWDRRLMVFPFVFYTYSRTLGSSLSVLPFYVNLEDFLGYQRVRMVLFPAYLKLEEPLVQHTWAPFPFFGWTSGPIGRGWRLWPAYGWDEQGEQRRFHYIGWPFYIVTELHYTRPERERRVVSFPFFARADSPSLRSRSYAFFFTHTTDEKQRTDTRGFPWPLWMSQHNLDTHERTALRIAPFYQDTHLGDVHAHFVMWPAYRWETQDVDDYHYRRSDVFLVVRRNIREEQPQYDHERTLVTQFPAYIARSDDTDRSLTSLALLDALFPRNPMVQRLYAPLWYVYSREQSGTAPPRWSVLWDLISSDGNRIRYPVRLDWTSERTNGDRN